MRQATIPTIIHMDVAHLHSDTAGDLRITLEREIRRQCAGVLQGRRVAQLALVEGTHCAGGCHHNHAGGESAAGGCESAAFTAIGRTFVREGVIVRQLAGHHCGRLLYVFRPDLLMCTLSDERIHRVLRGLGYDTRSVGTCVAGLAERASCEGGTFPCEVSFFLGRPFEDTSIMRYSGMTNSLCDGPWRALLEVSPANREYESFMNGLARLVRQMPDPPQCPMQQAMN